MAASVLCKIPLGSRTARDLRDFRVPLIIRTFPDPETHFSVTITRPNLRWRANGRPITQSFAKSLLRYAA